MPLDKKNGGTLHNAVAEFSFGTIMEKAIVEPGNRAYFRKLAGVLKGQKVNIKILGLEGEPFRMSCDTCLYTLEPESVINIGLVTTGLGNINGVVLDENRHPVPGAQIFLLDIQTETDQNGLFNIRIPLSRQRRLQTVTVIKSGYQDEVVADIPSYLQIKPLELVIRKDGL
jgi:hypothetical protein